MSTAICEEITSPFTKRNHLRHLFLFARSCLISFSYLSGVALFSPVHGPALIDLADSVLDLEDAQDRPGPPVNPPYAIEAWGSLAIQDEAGGPHASRADEA